jgi:2'-5' RNA ligase
MPAGEDERWRLFIAVALPKAVQDKLEAPLKDLQALSTWFRVNSADRIHLTLHFLGNVDPGKTGKLIQVIRPVVAAHQRFALSVEWVGAFRDIERPKVLWAGLRGSGAPPGAAWPPAPESAPELMRLQADIGHELVEIGFEVEPRFTPHLTLGRVRKPLYQAGSRAVNHWYLRWQFARFGEFTVDGVRLMRSQLGAGPPRYTTLATFDLQ